MKKIKLNENDIKQMVLEGVKKVLYFQSGEEDWCIYDVIEDGDLVDEYVNKGIIPPELAQRDYGCPFEIIRKIYDEREVFDGDYDRAMTLINAIKDPQIKQTILSNFQQFCENIETDEDCDDFSDEIYDSRRDNQ